MRAPYGKFTSGNSCRSYVQLLKRVKNAPGADHIEKEGSDLDGRKKRDRTVLNAINTSSKEVRLKEGGMPMRTTYREPAWAGSSGTEKIFLRNPFPYIE